MIALLIYRTLADHLPRLSAWLLKLSTRCLAHGLNVPEPLVQSGGEFVIARVLAFEHGVSRTLRPSRLSRMVRGWSWPQHTPPAPHKGDRQ